MAFDVLPSDSGLKPAQNAQAGAKPSAPPRSAWWHWYVAGLIAADTAGALAAVLITWLVRGPATAADVLDWVIPFRFLGFISVPTWLIAQAVSSSYRPSHSDEEFREYRSALVVGLRLTAVVAVLSYAIKADLSRLVVVVYFPSLIVATILARAVVRRVLSALRKRGRALTEVLLTGDEEAVREVANHMFRGTSHGYVLSAVCLPGGASTFSYRGHEVPVISDPSTVVAAARAAGVKAVAVATPNRLGGMTLQQLSWQLERSGIDLLVAPAIVDVAGPRIRVAPLTGLPLLHITEPQIDGIWPRVSAFVNRILAIPLAVALSPLMALIAVIVLIDSGRPIFYRQTRVGLKHKRFEIIKFRTMVPDADSQLDDLIELNEHDGALFKIRADPRVTRVGRWLRKYSLDELPQIFNVIKGDMVFVGPRPVRPREITNFGQAEERRFFAKPGVTGLWQVSGRADIPWEDAVKLDLYYVENWSPALDLMILFRTIRVVLKGTGT